MISAAILYPCPSCNCICEPFTGECPHCGYDYTSPYDWLNEDDSEDEDDPDNARARAEETNDDDE